MDVQRFEVEVTVNRKKLTVKCEKFQVHKVPQIYACLKTGERHEPVFIFYEVGPGELFWHDWPDEETQAIAWKIAKSLFKMI